MRTLVCTLLLLCSIGFASEIQLKQKLAEASPGSYVVMEQNKIFTFLCIHDLTDRTIVLEEISIPAARFAQRPMNWKQWFEGGAPGHTSWIISEVNLETGIFEETYSYTHKGWIDMSESNPFLTTLLNLRFQQVPEAKRRKIGLPPGHNKVDRRAVWNPRLIVDGQIIPQTPFVAYATRWPADGTELSRKIIEVYLPTAQESPPYPTYFPYWLEVEGRIGSAKVRVIDSGLNAQSPKPSIPKRPLQQLGDAQFNEKGLFLYFKSPPYYQDFLVLAEQTASIFGSTYPLPCQTHRNSKDIVSLFVPKEELQNLLTHNDEYQIVISPKEDPNVVLRLQYSLKLGPL